jgi:hypothetical protein
MSIFYNAVFIRTQKSEIEIKAHFRRANIVPDSEWVICDFSDDYVNGVFEPGAYFTKEVSLQFGEAIFICVDTMNDQFEYEHSINGQIARKLSWISDGGQSTWEWIEGEPEEWEDAVIFSAANFTRACELIEYDEHLQYLPEDERIEKEQALRSIWYHREYMLGNKWPLGDATMGMAIQDYFGLKVPLS